jgi:hypothetical protein
MALGKAFYTVCDIQIILHQQTSEWYEPQLAVDEESFKSKGKNLKEREG